MSASGVPRTVLGFDFGCIRIGVAVGQAVTATARPLATLINRQQQPDWKAITRLIAEWQPDLLVVGIPRHADGSANKVTTAALRFSRRLHGRYHLPVELMDERLSSWEATQHIATKSGSCQDQGLVDRMAAAFILESWFAGCGTEPGCKTFTH